MDDFYDLTAPFHRLVFQDWEASIERQADQLTGIIRRQWAIAVLVSVSCTSTSRARSTSANSARHASRCKVSQTRPKLSITGAGRGQDDKEQERVGFWLWGLPLPRAASAIWPAKRVPMAYEPFSDATSPSSDSLPKRRSYSCRIWPSTNERRLAV